MRTCTLLFALALAIGAPISSCRASEPTPVEVQIMGLERGLTILRFAEERGGWPPFEAGHVLAEGMDGAIVRTLRRRLIISDDLSATADSARYDTELAQAVKRFQKRHGLAADGRVGSATSAALNVPVRTRIFQLELNKARLQSLPDLGPSYIQINAAAASLGVVDGDRLVLEMPVVVGDRNHPTPVFHSRVTAVVFYPPWNVPHSIAATEILPRLRRDSRYLARNEIRIVNRPDDPFGLKVNWKRVAAGSFPFLLQQHPGPRNPLGLLKFNVPNEYDIHLHDTPLTASFQRSMRALSHGCVRLSKPKELAAWLLGPQGWSGETIESVLDASETRRVPVERSVPVHVLYLTAFVDAEGAVNFRQDIYGRDDEALLALSAPAQPVQMAKDGKVGCGPAG